MVIFTTVYSMGIGGFAFLRMSVDMRSNDTDVFQKAVYYWTVDMSLGMMLLTTTLHCLTLGITTGALVAGCCCILVFYSYVICKEYKVVGKRIQEFKDATNNLVRTYVSDDVPPMEQFREHHRAISDMVMTVDDLVVGWVSVAIGICVTFSIMMVYVVAMGSKEEQQQGFMYLVAAIFGSVMVLFLWCAAVVKSAVSANLYHNKCCICYYGYNNNSCP